MKRFTKPTRRAAAPALALATVIALAVLVPQRVATAGELERRVDVPRDRSGAPGETLTVPVLLDAASGLEAVDIEIAYDPAVLSVAEDGVRAGDLVDDPSGLFAFNVIEATGTILAAVAIPAPHEPAAGTLLEVDFTIAPGAAAGTTPINLVRVSLNEDGLPLLPEPTPAETDEVDGIVTIGGGTVGFKRADANGDAAVNISDPQYTLNFLFLGGPGHPCVAAADSNADGAVNISDPQYTLNFLFLGGPPPGAPYPNCGISSDPDDVRLGCEDTSCDG